ncbi:MAG: hypothetical protein HPY61_04455 [Methanotrichaceae archaeon]|nr:hypothetical protein [Methanotrichaceae archaeon]
MIIVLTMRLSLIVLIALLCIPMTAFAENDSAAMGPYIVHFDLGVPKSSYILNISEPIEHESKAGNLSTIYKLDITNKTESLKTARIQLTYFDDPQSIPTAEDIKSQILYEINTLILYILNNPDDLNSVFADTCQIDGTTGAVGHGKFQHKAVAINDSYLAVYYPLLDPEHLKCEIMSTYPWNDGTLHLLNTIHVEKAD